MAEPPAEIAFDEEDFGFCRITLGAVSKLARQRSDIECALAAGQLAGLAGRFACGGCLDDLTDEDFGFARMFFEPGAQRLVDETFDNRTDFRGNELILGLRGEFRIRHFDRQNRSQAFAAIFALQRYLFPFGDAGTVGIGNDLARQRRAEAGHMRAAVALRDVVGEAEHVLMIAVVPPHRDFNGDAVLFAVDGNRLVDERLLGAVQIGDESLEATVITQLFLLDVGMALVGQQDADA